MLRHYRYYLQNFIFYTRKDEILIIESDKIPLKITNQPYSNGIDIS